ncbi:hypothetical protein Q4525_13545 [Shimia thalassica]|uniref:hypothetical protein n=1 Tax=Shimia thalassica TaxID=1715693 RepID=UPI001C09D621|nr:hypothetical protein [Shimia thalassica]MBU2941658.1 hypothetical protein [Shimia thalassica]MDO6503961.1 hypothetical protein [Shimia thalassica]
MLALYMLLAVGAGIAMFDVLDDSDSSSDEDTEEGEVPVGEDPDTLPEATTPEWEGEDIRVTEDGEDPEMVVSEDVYRTYLNTDPDNPRYFDSTIVTVGQGYNDSEADELIETNYMDDTFQVIRAEQGQDTVEIGLGDYVDVRTEDDATGDDVAGEEGDTVIVNLTADDLENAPRLELNDRGRITAEYDDHLPLFRASLGSQDNLEINLPEGVEGSLGVVEGTSELYYGTMATGAYTEEHYALLLFAPEGQTLPEDLTSEEEYIYGRQIQYAPEDVEGVRIIGLLDLGEDYHGAWQDEPDFERDRIDHTVGLPNISQTV